MLLPMKSFANFSVCRFDERVVVRRRCRSTHVRNHRERTPNIGWPHRVIGSDWSGTLWSTQDTAETAARLLEHYRNTNTQSSTTSAMPPSWNLQEIKDRIVDSFKQCVLTAGASNDPR